VIEVETTNRSGAAIYEAAVAELARRILDVGGVHDGELGIAFVGPDEIRALGSTWAPG
jgi:hypothetical protein